MGQRDSIALVGLSGAGKSSVARLLAAQLGWPLADTDALIAASAGRSVPQIFAEDGEPHFRALEAQALAQALAGPPRVVATGGGIVLLAANRALLRAQAYVVWLDAPIAALVARLQAHDEQRPLLQGTDPAARLAALHAARAALYAEVAHLHIDTAGQTPEQVAGAIVRGRAQ